MGDHGGLTAVVVALAFLASAAGVLAFGGMLAQRGAAPGLAERLENGGLVLGLERTEWLKHDVFGGPMPPTAQNFPMPQSMMPGMQLEGNIRLHLEVTLRNPGNKPRTFGPDEFRVRTERGSWPLNIGSLAPTRVTSGMAMSIDLFFDVPETEKSFQLVWTRDGKEVVIPVSGEPPAHGHGG